MVDEKLINKFALGRTSKKGVLSSIIIFLGIGFKIDFKDSVENSF